MNVFFRADASNVLGSGHIMRCITLAKELQKEHQVNFICAEHEGNLIDLLIENGFVVHVIKPSEIIENNIVSNFSYDWEKDLEESLSILKNIKCDYLIIDHYFLDDRWEKRISANVGVLVVLDDLKNREHWCDILIDQNFQTATTNPYLNLMKKNTTFLLGKKYALLRDEFIENRKSTLNSISSIFVYFGASDTTSETLALLQAFSRQKNKYHLKVVIGYANSSRDEIISKYDNYEGIELFDQNNSISLLMKECDISIGAGGSTTWERCCIGLPSIVIPVADNQLKPMKELEKAGVIYLLEDNQPQKYEELFSKLNSFDLDFWLSIQKKGIDMFDGHGKARIKNVIMEGQNEY